MGERRGEGCGGGRGTRSGRPAACARATAVPFLDGVHSPGNYMMQRRILKLHHGGVNVVPLKDATIQHSEMRPRKLHVARCAVARLPVAPWSRMVQGCRHRHSTRVGAGNRRAWAKQHSSLTGSALEYSSIHHGRQYGRRGAACLRPSHAHPQRGTTLTAKRQPSMPCQPAGQCLPEAIRKADR